MGVTILAAGTSVPDAIGSLLVARDGQGDMAVSNAIGSNVFDILLGLGLPWTLSGIIWPEQPGVPVDTEAIVPLSIILVGTLVAVYLVALLNGFRLTKCVGFIFFSFYFIFVAYDLLHEFDYISF
jgi:sodium/potassium/calcium exchanger 4